MIFGSVPEIVAAHKEEVFDHTQCYGSKKNPTTCRDVYRVETLTEVPITFNKEIYLVFVREPIP